MSMRKCTKIGCEHAGKYIPRLCVPAKGHEPHPTNPMGAMLPAIICEKHFQEHFGTPEGAQRWLGDDIKQAFIQALSREDPPLEPDFERAFCIMVSAESRSGKDFIARQPTHQPPATIQ
jgi:hypothetical protein